MKKLLFVLCSMLIIAGLTTAAFATHPAEPAEKTPMVAKGKTAIELGGSIRFRGEYKNDIIRSSVIDLNESDSDNITDHDAKYDGRVRLHVNAYVTDNTMGRVNIETGSSNTKDTYDWGCSTPEGKGTYGEGNCKKGELRVLEAWIQHQGKGLLGVPAGIKIGHMPVQLGRGLFLNHSKFGDDAINVFVNPTDALSVELLYSKFTEGTSSVASDDTDLYALIANYKAGAFNVGGDVTYIRDKNLDADGDSEPNDGTDLWNIALRGDTKFNGVNVYGEVDLQTGKITHITDDDIDIRGWAMIIGADMKLADIGLNAAFAYGSGDDDPDDSKYKEFITAQHGSQKFTYVYDYRLFTAATGDTGTSLGATDTGIANTMYARLGVTAKPMPALNVAAELYWLKAAKDVTLSDDSREDDIGWELDARATYNIDTNLQYFIEGGVLFAGDLYDNMLDLNDENDVTPWAVRHGIQLAF